MTQEMVEKVTAFITRERQECKELLVFEHALSGVQVPAGTVETGEEFAEAVTREVWEETGYQGQIVRLLGEERQDLPDSQWAVLASAPLRELPKLDAVPVARDEVLGNSVRRGLVVRSEREEGDWLYIVLEDYNLEVEPPRMLRSIGGWIPRVLVSRSIHRTYFEMCLLDETPQRWEHFAEGRYTFHLYWQSLEAHPRLVNGQQQWLERFHEALMSSPIDDGFR
ncbi:NUDIX domain-containing protein [Ktedonospora formicarum]|uniref:Nudix hydrolase domain-containing protein n=1 Tax=Ktedonospora formicarum TaxID=2778364 RepID=A0A8J3HZ00_9CHLR|nr:NUDIX domain-containing protein [Ktedonospora formicarum]GHO43237.1 hypothetical protein KSX_14000 [Ktedonospora formicarum]